MTLGAPLSLNTNVLPGDRLFLRFKPSFGGQAIAAAMNRLASALGSASFAGFSLEGFPVYDPAAQTVNMIVRVSGTSNLSGLGALGLAPLVLAVIIAAIVAVAAIAVALVFYSAQKIISALTERETQEQILQQCNQLQAQGRFAEAERCRQQAAGQPDDFMAKHWPLLFLGLGLGVFVFVQLTE